METVTISPKYQVVLPKTARIVLGLKVGQKMIVFAYDSRVVLVPERPIREARGSLKSKDTTIERESVQHHLPMADSLILATAREHGAVLWTQDEHFERLEDVKYFAKRRV